MTFLEKGYLADDLAEWPAKVRASFPTYSRLAREMSDLIQWTISEMGRSLPRSETRNVMALASTMRLAEFVQGAITLLERGMITAARTCLRSGLETGFFLGGFADIPDFYQKALNEHVFQMTRMLRAKIRHAEQYLEGDERDQAIATVREAMADTAKLAELPEGVTEQKRGWNLRDDVAAKCGLIDIYDEYYRALSLDAAHAGLSAVLELLDKTEPGALNFGPGAGDYFVTFYHLVMVGDVGLSQCNVLLKSHQLRERLTALSTEMTRLEMKRRGLSEPAV